MMISSNHLIFQHLHGHSIPSIRNLHPITKSVLIVSLKMIFNFLPSSTQHGVCVPCGQIQSDQALGWHHQHPFHLPYRQKQTLGKEQKGRNQNITTIVVNKPSKRTSSKRISNMKTSTAASYSLDYLL